MSPNQKPNWQQQTPAQRLSNRTVLRFKIVADELCNALKSIMPEIDGVLFVSADRTEEIDEVRSCSPPQRYYNLRLLQTCQFTNEEEIKPLWNWLLKNADQFEVLFRLAANVENKANRFPRFNELIAEANKSPADPKKLRRLKESVHDLLIEAIAVMPYTHLLPSVFDSVFFKNSWKSTNDKPYWFEFNGKEKKVEVWEFDGFVKQCPNNLPELDFSDRCQDLIAQGHFAAKGSPKDMEDRKALGELYLNVFINDFMLGSDLKNPKPIEDEWYSPYRKRKGNLKSVKGFFIPVYHFQDSKGKSAGGFEGWMIAIFNKEPEVSAQNQPRSHNEAFKLALRGFAQRLSWERMRELTEKDWGGAVSPREFTLQHYQHFGGWEGVPDGQISLPPVPPDEVFMFGWLDKGETMEFQIYSADPRKEAPEYIAIKIAKITHVAVVPPAQQSRSNEASNQPFLFKIRPDTILPAEHHDLVSYGFHIARSVTIIYESACLREAQRTSGLLASAHDYSKQVGAAGTRLYEYNSRLEKVKSDLGEYSGRIKSAASLEEAREQAVRIDTAVRNLHEDRLEWFDVVQFNLDHLQARTQGAQPLNSPASCVGFLEKGTKRSIYALINRLVWLPLDYEGYKGLEDTYSRHAPEKLDDPLTWAILFQYDTGAQPGSAVHKELGRRISELILKERITQEQFWERFPVPVINPTREDLDEGILWTRWPSAEESHRLKPVVGLLPLFVFTLRFAYQCAWARTILQSDHQHAIEIQSEYVEAEGAYRIHIQFPAPIEGVETDVNVIPYYVEWKRQLDHYRGGKVYPWNVLDSVTQLPGNILETVLEARI